MSGVYKVEAVSPQTAEYTERGKALVAHFVRLENAQAENGQFFLAKYPSSNPPKEGWTLNVERFQPVEVNGTMHTKIQQAPREENVRPSGGSTGPSACDGPAALDVVAVQRA
jgi:hypothetical protein